MAAKNGTKREPISIWHCDITGTNQIVPRSAMNLEKQIRSCAVQWSSIRIVFYKIVLICKQAGKPIACFRKKKKVYARVRVLKQIIWL